VSDGLRSHPDTFSNPKDGLLSHPDSDTILNPQEINFVSSSSSVVLFLHPFEEESGPRVVPRSRKCSGLNGLQYPLTIPPVYTHPCTANRSICDSTPKHISAVPKYSVFFSPGDATRTGEAHGGGSLCRCVGIGVVREHSSNGAELHKSRKTCQRLKACRAHCTQQKGRRRDRAASIAAIFRRQSSPVGAQHTIRCPQGAPIALSAHTQVVRLTIVLEWISQKNEQSYRKIVPK